jgi:type IV pilus assembly protein PilQ
MFGLLVYSLAEQAQGEKLPDSVVPLVPEQAQQKIEDQTIRIESLMESTNVTLDFKDADIRNVLKIISYKSGVNIVTTPEVIGNVTIRLVNVPWEKALDVILKTYGFGYEKQGNIITVAPLEKLTAMKKQEGALADIQPTQTEVFNLKFIDALDAKKALDPQLSPRGRITVLEMTGQSGWQFGSMSKTGEYLGTIAQKTTTQEPSKRSKMLIISDTPPVLDKIREVIKNIDIMPKQVLIETRIMEVNRSKLKDIGFDWGTGSDGARSTTIYPTPISKANGNTNSQLGGNSLGSQVEPSVFNPLAAGASGISGINPYNTGLSLLFQKLNGTQFSMLLHALEEDVNTNTLSCPNILTLNNQEATILVGSKYPILTTNVSTGSSSPVTTTTLGYYQDIGIQLNVVPQIGENNYINMVIHPAVSTQNGSVSGAGISNTYPIIDIREAETRILMRDGETVAIGGLLKDVKSKGSSGIPFLSKIPVVGALFRRNTDDVQKIDLLIFITARIIKEGGLSAEEIAKLENRLGQGLVQEKAITKKKKR